MKPIWGTILSLCLGLAGVACQSGSTVGPGTDGSDTGKRDAGDPDAGEPDAGQPDAGQPDGTSGDDAGGDDQHTGPQWQVVADWPTGPVTDISVDGNELTTVNTYGLLIYDVTDPQAPVLEGRRRTTGEALRLAVDGTLAAVADGRSGIVLVDISDPDAIEPIATVPVTGEARGVALRNGLLLAGSSHAPPRLVDVSDPAAPVELAVLPGYATSAVFSGNLLLTFGPLRSEDDPPEFCTVDTRQILRVLDISDPAQSVEIGSIQYGAEGHDPRCEGHAVVMPQAGSGLAVAGSRVYVVETETIVHTIDITDPAAPTEISRIYAPGHWVRGLAVESDRLFVNTDEEVAVFDLSDPDAPEQAGVIALPAVHTFLALAADSDRVAVLSASTFHGLHVLDMAEPHDLRHLGSVDVAHAYVAQMVLGTSHAMLASHPNFMVIDLADPARPRIEVVREDLGGMNTLALHDGLLLLAGDQGVITVDATEPGHPVVLGTCDVEWLDARHAALDHDLGLVVSGSTSPSLRTLDLSDPSRPAVTAQIHLPGVAPSGPRVDIRDGFAYIACGTGGLAVVDVGNPAEPVITGSWVPSTGDFAHDVVIGGNLAFVAAGQYVHVLDVSDPAAPRLVDEVDTPGYAHRLAWTGEKLVVDDMADIAVLALQ